MFSRPFCGGRLGEGEEDRGIHSILCLQAREQPAGIAAVTLGDEGGDIVSKVTWSQLLHATQQLAAELLRANVQNGDRIAILGHNCEMFLAALFACSMIGAVSVPLNPRWSIQELGFAVGDCQPAFCLCFDGIEFSALSSICMDKVLAVMLPKLVLAYEPQPLGSSCSSMHSHALSSTPGQKLRCRSTILYTSGSTGSPKGVILSHSGQLAQASAKCQEVGYWGHTLYLNVAPLCHVGGFNSALACSLAGGRHVFLSYKFNPDAAMAAIEAASVSLLVLVPAMLHMMLESFIKDRPLETVRTILVGGQSMSDSLLARAHATFSAAQIFQTYASTEAGSTITLRRLRRGSRLTRCSDGAVPVGHSVHWARLRLCQHGVPVPPGQVGEVETQGPHVMVGYWKRPQLTLSVLNEDGWLRTGDVARLDCDTRELHLLGRIRDVIKTGGELVVSAEVESVLSLHPWVAEVAVLGVASEKYGELVSAVVVLSKQYSVLTKSLPDTRHALTQWCKQRMAGFKVPKMWHFRHEPLPRNSVGKLQKHLLLAPASLIRSFL